VHHLWNNLWNNLNELSKTLSNSMKISSFWSFWPGKGFSFNFFFKKFSATDAAGEFFHWTELFSFSQSRNLRRNGRSDIYIRSSITGYTSPSQRNIQFCLWIVNLNYKLKLINLLYVQTSDTLKERIRWFSNSQTRDSAWIADAGNSSYWLPLPCLLKPS
jgi:hypothetical protein